jgi:hypothetical protein
LKASVVLRKQYLSWRFLFPSPPPLKKRNKDSSQNPTLQTYSSPKHPGTDAKEDPHHQSRVNVRLSMFIKTSFHRATKSNTTHLSITG